MSRRKTELVDLEKKVRLLEDEAESLISSSRSEKVSGEEYVSRRAELEKEFADITDRITWLRFVKGRRSRSEKT